jgi:plastocyanin
MRAVTVLMCILVCAAFTCGCTAQTTTSQNSQPQATRVMNDVSHGPVSLISIKATSFDPYNLEITTGTTVRWVNDDRMPRHVVHLPTGATDRELFNSGSLSPKESFSYTFTKPGRYVYGDPQHGGGRSPFVNVTDPME